MKVETDAPCYICACFAFFLWFGYFSTLWGLVSSLSGYILNAFLGHYLFHRRLTSHYHSWVLSSWLLQRGLVDGRRDD
jgi:hypothetical protein